jgi:hypothetical protein
LKYLLVILFLSFQVITSLAQSSKPLQKGSKAYNGLYIFYDQLNEIFPVANITNVSGTIDKALLKKEYYQSSLCILVRNFYPQSKDVIALKDFIRDGNDVLILASDFNETMHDYFDFESTYNFHQLNNTISFETDDLIDLEKYKSKRLALHVNSFTKYDTSRATVLGTNADGTSNFIKMKYGKGSLYLHLYPEVATNFFLVEQNNYTYTEKVLSFLPRNSNHLLIVTPRPSSSNGSYDTSSGGSSNNASEGGFFSFIRNNPNLFAAFLIGLLIFGLLIIFGFKKRQREIPIIPPVTNSTLDFAKTMGDLYFNSKNNIDLAHKKIIFWQEHVRTKYQIPTHTMGKDFWEKLSKKSGATQENLHQLERSIAMVKTQSQISDKLLIQLNNSIDQFNKC